MEEGGGACATLNSSNIVISGHTKEEPQTAEVANDALSQKSQRQERVSGAMA